MLADVCILTGRSDVTTSQEICDSLRAAGISVLGVATADSISSEFHREIQFCQVLLLIVSDQLQSNEWSRLEPITVYFRDPTASQKRFLPIRTSECIVPKAIEHYAFYDMHQHDINELIIVIRSGLTQDDSEAILQQRDLNKFIVFPDEITAIDTTLDGNLAVASRVRGGLVLIDLKDLSHLAIKRPIYQGPTNSVAISKDGSIIVAGYGDGIVGVWRRTGKHYTPSNRVGHLDAVSAVALSKDEKWAVSGANDRQVRLWSLLDPEEHFVAFRQSSKINSVAISHDAGIVVSGGFDGRLYVFDRNTNRQSVLIGHHGEIHSVILLKNAERCVTAGADATIRIWNIHSGCCIGVLEGHTREVLSISVDEENQFLVSGSVDRSIAIWDLESGSKISQKLSHTSSITAIKSFGDGQCVVTGSIDGIVKIWRLDKFVPRVDSSNRIRYTNAKVLIVGESGVGKTGLVGRLVDERFSPSISTDAHWVTQLRLQAESDDSVNKEIWLWDFAGQADYRLIHQLFMDETSLAVLVFNPQTEDPFSGLRRWNQAISRASRRLFAKLLVAGRCDRGSLMVSRKTVEDFAVTHSFKAFCETSALSGMGCDDLRDKIIANIDWDAIPWTTSPKIFRLLKDGILKLRDRGIVILLFSELKQQLEFLLATEERETTFTLEELHAVVGLLAGPGIVCKLDFGDVVVLIPEWINRYAAAVIRSVREHIGEIGVIDEARVLVGDLNFTLDVSNSNGVNEDLSLKEQRLKPTEEAIILRAMHQMFVDHGLCLVQEVESGGRQLVFPTCFRTELPVDPGHPPVLVSYSFEGDPEEIYATLVVQLWRSMAFEKDALWRYAADFKSSTGARLGLKLNELQSGVSEICIYFDPAVQEDTKVTFIKYVHEHLLRKATKIKRRRAHTCSFCGHPVRDMELAEEIIAEKGRIAEIRCQNPKCDEMFSLWDTIEEKFASREFLRRVEELSQTAKLAIDNESRELILEGHARVVSGEAGQIYRGYTGSDHGIDGEIELKDEQGLASGMRLYLQLKSGDSYLSKPGAEGMERFRIKKRRWATYWKNQAYPVMLVIRTSDGRIRWMNVSEWLKRNPESENFIIFDGQEFTAQNLLRLRNELLKGDAKTI